MKRVRSRLKLFIEECGKHPFATGLFALLGVFGLAFSIYAYRIDRLENLQDSQAQGELRGDLAAEFSDLDAQISNLPGAMAEGADFDPIDASFDPLSWPNDNVTFPASYIPEVQALAASADPLDIVAELRRRSGAFSDEWVMQFSVTSRSDRNFVQIAPYLVFEVLSVREIPGGMASVYFGERGAGAEVRSFSASIPPQRGMHFGPLIDPYSGEFRTDIDFFTLEPREPEEFFLQLTIAPGYIYEMRMGLHYKYQDRHRIHWVTAPFVTGLPSEPLPVMDFGLAFEDRPYPGAEANLATDFTREAAQARTFVMRGKVFNPRQIAP